MNKKYSVSLPKKSGSWKRLIVRYNNVDHEHNLTERSTGYIFEVPADIPWADAMGTGFRVYFESDKRVELVPLLVD